MKPRTPDRPTPLDNLSRSLVKTESYFYLTLTPVADAGSALKNTTNLLQSPDRCQNRLVYMPIMPSEIGVRSF